MARTLLSAHALVRAHGSRTLLSSVSLSVDDASAIALVGRNGAGKSTLLRLLAGAEAPDSGRVIRGHGVAVLHLPQLDGAAGDAPVRALLHQRLGVASAAARMDALAAQLADGADGAAAVSAGGGGAHVSEQLVDAHAMALEHWLARGGADVDVRLDRAAADAGLTPGLLERPPAELSGGQRARAMLAALTAARADVLLLDEPANHLDGEGLERLRRLLRARRGGVVLVAHDRALLAETTNRVVELDAHDGTLTEYGGGFAAYETERARAHRHANEAQDRALAERERLLALETAARRRAVNGQRNARSENDRSLRHLHEQSAQRVSGELAVRYARRAARVEIPERPWHERPARLAYVADRGRAGVVAALHGAVLARGGFTLGPLELEVHDGDRRLLAGPNGCGKSTLIAALAGRIEPIAGQLHRVEQAIAELGQERGSLLAGAHPDLVAAVRAHAGLDERAARAALAAMGLVEPLVMRPVATLSPGERTRAELAAATAAGARLLLLDEPTNHLDAEALAALEAALEAWPGALVVATHDARLRANLRLDATLELDQDVRRPPTGPRRGSSSRR